MYCPNCAAPYSYGLRYCKQCGTNLNEGTQPVTAAPPPAPKITGAAWALAMATATIVLGGLGIIVSNATDLMRTFPGEVRTGNPTPVAIVMLVFGSVTIFGVVGLLMRLFTHLIVSRPQQPAPPAPAARPLASAPPPVQLPAPPSAVGSVTEHTTRNFEPSVYDKLRARE